MKTIAIISTAGGAGRSTLTASLAGLLMARRHAVLAVECDPRNVLALHCGLREPAREGLSGYVQSRAAHAVDAALQSDDGVLWLPWGDAGADGASADAAQAGAVTVALQANPAWLRGLLAQVDMPAHGVVLVDAATWPSIHAAQAIEAADLVMVIVPPQPTACAALPRLRTQLQALGKAALYVANGVSPAIQLHTDVLALLRHMLGAELSPYRIHADSGIPEALARNQNFHLSAPHSQAAHDMQGLATWLSSWLRQAPRTAASGAGGAP